MVEGNNNNVVETNDFINLSQMGKKFFEMYINLKQIYTFLSATLLLSINSLPHFVHLVIRICFRMFLSFPFCAVGSKKKVLPAFNPLTKKTKELTYHNVVFLVQCYCEG